MIIVSTSTGDFSFQSTDDVLNFVQTEKNCEIWISGTAKYPCMAICINGKYAAVHYFQNDAGDMWLSYNEKNQKEVTFISSEDAWKPDVNAVIRLRRLFCFPREKSTRRKCGWSSHWRIWICPVSRRARLMSRSRRMCWSILA